QCHLLFLHRAYRGNEGDVRAYEAGTAETPNAALGDYVRTRAAWLRAQPIRRVRLFLFYSQGRSWSSPLERGYLGLRLMFRPVESVTLALHHRRLKELATLRDRLQTHLEQVGLASRELEPEDIQQLHYELLNPNLSRRVPRAPRVELQDTLWSPRFLR